MPNKKDLGSARNHSNGILKPGFSNSDICMKKNATIPKIGTVIIITLTALILISSYSSGMLANFEGWFDDNIVRRIAKIRCDYDKDSMPAGEFCSSETCRIGYPDYCCEQIEDNHGWVEACQQPACLRVIGASKCCSEIRKSEGCLAALNSLDICKEELVTEECDRWWIQDKICRNSSTILNEVFSACWNECLKIQEYTVSNNLGVACTGTIGICQNQACREMVSRFNPDPYNSETCSIIRADQDDCSKEVVSARCPDGNSSCVNDIFAIPYISSEESGYVICPSGGCTSANAIRISPDLNVKCTPEDIQPCGNYPCKWNQVSVCNDQGKWICNNEEACMTQANLADPCNETIDLAPPKESEKANTFIQNDQIIFQLMTENKLMFEEYQSEIELTQSDQVILADCESSKTDERLMICRGINPGHIDQGQFINISVYPKDKTPDCLLGEQSVGLPDQCSEQPRLKFTGIEWSEDFTHLNFSFTSDFPLTFSQYSGNLIYRYDEYKTTCSVSEPDPHILSCTFRILKIDSFPRPVEFELSSYSLDNCVIQKDSYIISKREIEPSGSKPPAVIGRWTGHSNIHGDFSLIINSIDKIIERLMVRGRSIDHNDYRISGCIDLGLDHVVTPVTGILRYEDDIQTITIIGTEVSDQQGKITSFTGEIISEGVDYRAYSGRGEGIWQSTDSSGDWSLELDYGPTGCEYDNIQSSGLWFGSDVSQVVKIGAENTMSTHFLTETNIACGSILVTVPKGYQYNVDLQADTFSTGAITENILMYHRTRSGEPDSGKYTYTCIDVLGKPIGEIKGVDYYGGCDEDLPTEIDFEITPGGILVTWNPQDTNENGDHLEEHQSYRLELRVVDGEDVFIAESIFTTSHLIPHTLVRNGSEGNPDGINLGLGLDELEDGKYSIGVMLVTEPQLPDSTGIDCESESLDAKIYLTKSGEYWW